MRKFFIIIPLILATTGCASVGMSLLGSAASTTVSNVIGSAAERTFTLPVETVREGSLTALARMGVALRDPVASENPAGIYGKAGDRPIEVELEGLGENLTVMRVTARRLGILRDTATANEIVAQTERALEIAGTPAAAVAAAKPTRPVEIAAATTPARPVESPAVTADDLPPVYILNLEELPAGSARAMKPVPAQLQDYVVFTTDAERAGRRLVQVNLGYFSSETEADNARKVAAGRFPQARVVVLRSAQDVAAAPAEPRPDRALIRVAQRSSAW